MRSREERLIRRLERSFAKVDAIWDWTTSKHRLDDDERAEAGIPVNADREVFRDLSTVVVNCSSLSEGIPLVTIYQSFSIDEILALAVPTTRRGEAALAYLKRLRSLTRTITDDLSELTRATRRSLHPGYPRDLNDPFERVEQLYVEWQEYNPPRQPRSPTDVDYLFVAHQIDCEMLVGKVLSYLTSHRLPEAIHLDASVDADLREIARDDSNSDPYLVGLVAHRAQTHALAQALRQATGASILVIQRLPEGTTSHTIRTGAMARRIRFDPDLG